jgi:hypothetical protein
MTAMCRYPNFTNFRFRAAKIAPAISRSPTPVEQQDGY